MAVAGCINAYDCAGCYLTTLQQLQSDNIGVAINYTAPGEYGRRQLDYIKYTDKCGCTCCLTGENELKIVATQGVIKNFTLTNDDTNEVVNVKWNDLFGSNRAYTMVRYKTGSYPTSITDGTLAVKETTQNQYATSGYNVSGLTDGTTYYFTAFAVSQDGTIIVVQNKTITTDFGWHPSQNTLAWWKLEGTITDSSGNGRNGTGKSYTTYETLNSGLQVIKLTSGNAGVAVPGNIANLMQGDFTISMWMYITGQGQSGGTALMFGVWYDTDPFTGPNIWYGYNNNNRLVFRLRGGSGSNPVIMTSSINANSIQNQRAHICRTRINGVNTGYVNRIPVCTMTSTVSTSSGNSGYIVSRYGSTQSLASGSMGSHIIVENKGRTHDDVIKYVNKTSILYGDERSNYQEVEYIQTTGTQYIKAVNFPESFKFTITAQFDATNQYYNVYDTSESSGTSKRPMLWAYTDGKFELNIDNMSVAGVVDNTKFITVVSDATGNANTLSIDGTQVLSGSKITGYTGPTNLLHRSTTDGFKGKIKRIKLEGVNYNLLDLIPCYRKSDNVIGFYDMINHQFYTNQGSGTFTKGPNIN